MGQQVLSLLHVTLRGLHRGAQFGHRGLQLGHHGGGVGGHAQGLDPAASGVDRRLGTEHEAGHLLVEFHHRVPQGAGGG
ncbi:MAG: hypothetical protein QGH45_10655 [Myxococcota bacterium]|jgi:hypothetical protein|nr:hypothetical protein [Myxococcota bacterium]